MSFILATIIMASGLSGIGFMVSCIRRQRLTDRDLVIGGSLVIVNFILLGLLFVSL